MALAPELSVDGVPILAGSAYAGADGQLFDGSRCDILALRRHVRGGPLHLNAAANALLARIAHDPTLTAEDFRAAAAAALTCPLTGTVPYDPVAANNGRTYGRAALWEALACLPESAPASARPEDLAAPSPAAAAHGLEQLRGHAVPAATEAFVALVARLDLAPPAAAPSPATGEGDAYDDGAALPQAPSFTESDLLAELEIIETDLEEECSAPALFRNPMPRDGLGLPGTITDVDVDHRTVALGWSDGSVRLLSAETLIEFSYWPAYGPAAAGVAQIAASLAGVLTLGRRGSDAAAPLMWNTAGALLHRFVLPGDGPIAWIGIGEHPWAHALTETGHLASWRVGRFARATPHWQRDLGPGAHAACNGDRLAVWTRGEVEIFDGPRLSWAPPRPGIAQLAPLATGVLVRMQCGEVARLNGRLGGALQWDQGPRALREQAVRLLATKCHTWAACVDYTRVALGLVSDADGYVVARLSPRVAACQRIIVGRSAGGEIPTASIEVDAPVMAIGLDEAHMVALMEGGGIAVVHIHHLLARSL